VIRIEGTPGDGLRIIGALKSAFLSRLLETAGGGEVVLDLSEVSEADAASVRLLARLAGDQCRLVGCPKWLALWIEREGRPRRQAARHRVGRSE
jgi:ABC-type transporter Mla MlaB component